VSYHADAATNSGLRSDLLARHRIEIAGLGAAAFAAVVIGFLLG